ncbi:heterokaryon incompatibility protein-domain-containing protein [Hypoxylon sp. FL1150]|nr:heterokaryon incompatibility protein-domain-containing protein [Hypoxylon sp. FL1150]
MESPPCPFYPPLNTSRGEIRLLRILPASSDDETIRCELGGAFLPALRSTYAALSYVWGDPEATRNIHINGEPFSITENLHDALRMLRQDSAFQTVDFPLWVDAICINQRDVDERSQQVQLMASIYRSAGVVISWLGTPGVEGGDVAIRTIRDVVRAAYKDGAEEINKENLLQFISSQPRLIERGEDILSSHFGNSAWQATVILFERPYWRRVWIVQEMVLVGPASIHLLICEAEAVTFEDAVAYSKILDFLGTDRIPEKLGFTGSVWSWSKIGYPMGNLRKVALLRRVHQGLTKGKLGSPNILDISMHHQVTDARDSVYGFLAILNSNITVDYSKTTKEVYLDWYNDVIHQGLPRDGIRHPILFAGLGLDKLCEYDLPSWIPNLKRLAEIRETHLLWNYLYPRLHINAFCKCLPPSAEVVGPVMRVHGVRCCGIITDVFRASGSALFYEQIPKLCYRLLTRKNKKHHPLGISALQALYYIMYEGYDPETSQRLSVPPDQNSAFNLFRTVGCTNWNIGPPGVPREEKIEAERYADGYRFILSQAGFDSYQELVSAMDAAICKDVMPTPRPFLESVPLITENQYKLKPVLSPEVMKSTVFGACKEKAIFQTEDGYIGVGPGGLKEGDQACILDQVSLPMLLRKDDKGYRNVGACYIYGVSDNEVASTVMTMTDPRFERFEIYRVLCYI